MKLGYRLRQFHTDFFAFFRDSLDYIYHLAWLLFDPSKFKKIKFDRIKSLLIIYGGSVGDLYNALGIMNAINEKHPHIKIHFLTTKKNHKFLKAPYINVVERDEARKMMKDRKFDALVMLQGVLYKPELFKKSMYWEILKIPYRAMCDNLHITLAHKQITPPMTRRLKCVRSNGFFDQIDTFNMLGFDIDALKFYYTKESEKYADNFYKKYKIKKDENTVFLHVGGGSIIAAIKEDPNGCPTHLWPLDRWAAVANFLIRKYNARIVFTGTNEEKDLAKKITEKITNKKKVINIIGETSVEDVASIYHRGDLMIATDTGTAHVAAQTGIPLVDLFSSFHPRSTSPAIPSERKVDIFNPKVCNSCRIYTNCPEGENVCMTSIGIKEITDAADKFLKKK